MRCVAFSMRLALSVALVLSLSLPAVPVLAQGSVPLQAQAGATVFLPGVMNSLGPGTGLPEGDWQVTAVNPKGNTDSVETQITKGSSTLVVTNTDPEAGHVGDQFSLSVWISPSNPGAYVGVTVYAKISPAKADEAIYFSISGTDGYSKSGTYRTGSDGIATFYVPGGAKGVVDTITVRVESTGLTRTFVYSFA